MYIARSASTLVTFGLAAALVTGCGGAGAPTADVTSPATPAPTTATTGDGGAPPTTGTGGTTGDGGTGTQAPAAPAPAPTTPGGTTAHATHHRCGWIGADTFADGKATFLANPDYFDAIHPKWFTLNSDGSPRALAYADDADIMKTAQAHGVKVMPLIDADSASYLRAAMANPQAHAQALANIVAQRGYDGIELDYEHLWTAADRPGFTALVDATAALLHKSGKTLTLALPAMAVDDGKNAYDYSALQKAADVLHLMAYDYHYLGGDHLGPLAPLGWVEDTVKRVEALGSPGKYTLGLANYAIGNGWYTTAADAQKQCGANYPTTTTHMQSCSYGHQTAGIAPHCTTSKGDVWFEDGASAGEKAALAKAHGFGGIGYWTVGAEPSGFMSAIQTQYP